MEQKIRDLFTQEEWEIFSPDSSLEEVADLPLKPEVETDGEK